MTDTEARDALAEALPDVLSMATEADDSYEYSDEPGSRYVNLLADGLAAWLAARGYVLARPEPETLLPDFMARNRDAVHGHDEWVAAPARPEPETLNAERLRCGACGDDLLPGEVEGHLNSEGRTARPEPDRIQIDGAVHVLAPHCWCVPEIEADTFVHHARTDELAAAFTALDPEPETALRAALEDIDAALGSDPNYEDGPRLHRNAAAALRVLRAALKGSAR